MRRCFRTLLALSLVVWLVTGCGGGESSPADAAVDTETVETVGQDTVPDGFSDLLVPCESNAECEGLYPCRTGTCDDGWCRFQNRDGECDDEDKCTTGDQCVDGECRGNVAKCDDGKFCNGLEACDADTGECLKGPAPEVDDGVDCTVDKCDEALAAVTHTPDDSLCVATSGCQSVSCDLEKGCVESVKVGSGCDDGDNCTKDDKCDDAGACVGTPLTCDDQLFCNGLEYCDAATGSCAVTPVVVDDGVDCTIDQCDEVSMAVLNTPDHDICNDNNECTDDECKPEQGCINAWRTGECSDGNDCTVGDFCDGGKCIPGDSICLDEVCTGGEDEDEDLLIDCEDPDCFSDWACLPSGETCLDSVAMSDGALLIGSEHSLFFTTEGKANDYESSCVPFSGGADVVHQVEVGQKGLLAISLQPSGPQRYSVSLLPAACVGELACRLGESGAAMELVVPVKAGGYYVLVDGAGAGDQGSYTVTVRLVEPAASELYCDDGVDQDEDGLVDCFDLDCWGSDACGDPTGDGCDSPLMLLDMDVTAETLPLSASVTGDTSVMTNKVSGSCDSKTAIASDMVYFFKTEVPIVLDAQMEFQHPTLVMWPAIYVLDSMCSKGQELACARTNGDPAIVNVLLGPGTYYIVVDAAWSYDMGPFRLEVAMEAPPSVETNCMDKVDQDYDLLVDCADPDCWEDEFCIGFQGDSCSLPSLVNDGQPVGAALDGQKLTYTGSTVGYNDQYGAECSAETVGGADAVWKMEVAEPMRILLSHKFTSPGGGATFYPALYVYAGQCGGVGDELFCAYSSTTASIDGAFAPGTYYIIVDSSYIGDAAPYTLTLEFFDPPTSELECWNGLDDDGDSLVDCLDEDCVGNAYCLDPYEPNDVLDEAALLAAEAGGFAVEEGISIYPAHDADMFELPVSGKGFLRVTATPAPGLNVDLQLTDESGTELASGKSGGPGGLETLLYGHGVGTTLVLAVRGSGGTMGSYSLDFETYPASATETLCDDGVDNDLNGATDCGDPQCAQDFFCLGESCDAPKPIKGGQALTYLDAGVPMVFTGTTADNSDEHEGSCDDSTEQAADEVYMFVLSTPLRMSATMDFNQLALYPAIYLFSGECSSGAELACGYTVGSGGPARINDMLLQPGTYFLVVDGADPLDKGDYVLELMFGLPSTSEISCVDGADNDGDGFTDCCDSDCWGDDACVAETNCSDGKDNDCDLYSDCFDSDCATSFDCLGENCASARPVNDGVPLGADDAGRVLTYKASTAAAMPDYKSLNCDATATNSARDEVYVMTLAAPMKVKVSHDFDSGNRFAAVYVYKGSCVVTNEVGCASIKSSAPAVISSLVLPPDTYYIIVDAAYPTDFGAYTLTIELSALDANESNCNDGVDDDGDGLTDCCDADCLGAPNCFESSCTDGLDNDCNGLADCADAACAGVPECVGILLPFSADFEGIGNGPLIPSDWSQTGPDSKCGWAMFTDPLFGGHSLIMNDKLGCSTTKSYLLLSPLFDLDGCEQVGVEFVEKNEYATRYLYHSVGVWSGDTQVETVVPPGTDTATSVGPLYFDTVGMEKVKIFFAYRGDDADRWYIDDVQIYCASIFNYEVDCFDGKDNDKDDLIDCCDSDCTHLTECHEDCTDGIDNDCDGLADCCDSDCALLPVCGEICDDGEDNDCDGIVDCCDSDCSTNVACAEICNDGIDNNCNDIIDCCDTACQFSPFCQEICDDGKDNNCNDIIDCCDPGCKSSPVCMEICNDEKDNNCDDLVDCCDPTCDSSIFCAEVCDDGFDNGCDGLVDCQDPDCASFIDCLEEICGNGTDDDLDLLIDCDDVEDCGEHPTCLDFDGDGISDALDVCSSGDDAIDLDMDTLPDACEIGWAGQIWPNSGAPVVAGAEVNVYVRVWKPGVTDQVGAGAGVKVTLKYMNQGDTEWQSLPALFNGDSENDDEYRGTVPAGFSVSGTALMVDFEIEFLPVQTSSLKYIYNNDMIKDQVQNPTPLSYPAS